MKRRHAINVAVVIAVAGAAPVVYDELSGQTSSYPPKGRQSEPSSSNILLSEVIRAIQLPDVDACSAATPCATPTPTPAPTPPPTPAPTPTPTPTPQSSSL